MPKLKFKEAAIHDLNESLTMIRDFYSIDNYPFDQSKVEKNFREMTESEHLGRFWILSSEKETIGYLILTFGYSFEYGGRDAFIDEFYLHQKFRGQGFGIQVMKELDLLAAELGVRAIHLEVEDSNTVGSKLYLKSGYLGNQRSLLTKVLIE